MQNFTIKQTMHQFHRFERTFWAGIFDKRLLLSSLFRSSTLGRYHFLITAANKRRRLVGRAPHRLSLVNGCRTTELLLNKLEFFLVGEIVAHHLFQTVFVYNAPVTMLVATFNSKLFRYTIIDDV